jgi:hypothetical protein
MRFNESDQRLCCQNCGLTLGNWVGSLLVSTHAKRREISYPISIVCPRCQTAWNNPDARLSDNMGSVITDSLKTAATTPFVPTTMEAA